MAIPTSLSLASTLNVFDYAAPITINTSFTLCRGIYVGTATGVTGTMTVVMSNGDTVLFTGVLAGLILPIRCTKVNTTGTTATDLVALY